MLRGVILIGGRDNNGNDNNTISNNIIRDRTHVSAVPANLVVSLNASTTARNSNNAVTNNQLTNFTANGFATSAIISADNWTITGNEISRDGCADYDDLRYQLWRQRGNERDFWKLDSRLQYQRHEYFPRDVNG